MKVEIEVVDSENVEKPNTMPIVGSDKVRISTSTRLTYEQTVTVLTKAVASGGLGYTFAPGAVLGAESKEYKWNGQSVYQFGVKGAENTNAIASYELSVE